MAIVDVSADVNDSPQQESNERLIWRANVPFLYDMLQMHTMEVPSCTVQWLPTFSSATDVNDFGPAVEVRRQKLIYGTRATNQPNHLIVANVQLPVGDMSCDDGNFGHYTGTRHHVTVESRIYQNGEVYRARYMPQRSNLIGVKSVGCEICLFDIYKHEETPDADPVFKPELRLAGHVAEGYGLSWSPNVEGQLLSGSDDNFICLWDVAGGRSEKNTVKPISIYVGHTSSVADVAWHVLHENIFGSAGDDRNLIIWDARYKDSRKPTHVVPAHDAEVNCLSFNPFSEYILATGSLDKTVALWDLRNLKLKLHSFERHTNHVYQVQWSPHNETILASSSKDGRVLIWDLSKIGEEQAPEDENHGPPELLFIHGGHSAGIPDFSWNHLTPWMICSVAVNAELQLWQLADNIHNEDE